MKYLITYCAKTKAQRNVVDPTGRTILHIACQEARTPEVRYSVVQLLLNYDLDPNVKDLQGYLAVNLLPPNDKGTRKLLETPKPTKPTPQPEPMNVASGGKKPPYSSPGGFGITNFFSTTCLIHSSNYYQVIINHNFKIMQ